MKGLSGKAMIMAAGVGSRLDPLTQFVPKPLVPIANKPVMDILLERLVEVGVKDVIANTYYLADQIIERYSQNTLGVNFNYIKETELSGTAGGLKKCQFFFDEGEDFFVLSGDGLSNADLEEGMRIHKTTGAIATIGIKQVPMEEVPNFGVVVTDERGYITQFQEKPAIKDAKSNFINTGIYIFNYKIFDYIPENTFYDFAKNVFPKLLEDSQINTFEISQYWSDIGTLAQYKESNNDLFKSLYTCEHSPILKTGSGLVITESHIDKNVQIVGNNVIGKNCEIASGVKLENVVLWDNVKIKKDCVLKDCVIASNSIIGMNLYNQIVGANQCIESAEKELV